MTSHIILLSFLVISCYGVEFSGRPRNFSIELMYFTRLEHFVMSPYCVWCVMAGAFFGGYGESNNQIQRALLLPTDFVADYKNLTETIFDTKLNKVALATEMFVFQDRDVLIQPIFKAKLINSFNAIVKILDFQDTKSTAVIANTYIQSIFPKVTNLFHGNDFTGASVIMSNVIHFRGILSKPFNASYTTAETIYNENNEALGTVNMMHHTGKLPYSKFELLNSNILELPYGDDGKYCMLVILPDAGINPVDVYLKLDKVTLRDIFIKLDKDVKELGLKEVHVKMPRFRIRTSMTLKEPLKNMGIYDAFEPEHSGFDRLTQDLLYIGNVEHKSEIIFNEYETIALATTPGYYDTERSAHSVKAKKPFIFFLMEKPTATVFFGGIYSRHRNLNPIDSRIVFEDN